jgi:hypothetical protein
MRGPGPNRLTACTSTGETRVFRRFSGRTEAAMAGRGAAIALLFLCWSILPAAAQSPPSLCADCHFANSGGPDPRHLSDWDLSAHGRANVGCESCHGGNPRESDAFLAHRTMIRGRGADSPVNAANLPRTCGKCHTGPLVDFQKSRHYALLTAGNPDAPSCSTCHGPVAAQLPSPKSLESTCNGCHGVGRRAQRPEYAAQARLLLERVHDIRSLLTSAKRLIRRVSDQKVRASLQYDYEQAEVPLIEAVHYAHAFVFADTEERLGVARRRVEALTDRLANPPRP